MKIKEGVYMYFNSDLFLIQEDSEGDHLLTCNSYLSDLDVDFNDILFVSEYLGEL